MEAKIKLDEKDLKILELLQTNCKLRARSIAKEVGSPITTVFAKIRRMEKLGIIKGYRAILDVEKLGKKATAFILISVSYGKGKDKRSQREIAEEIAKFPEVQEVHIITGDWDILIKVRAEDVKSIGKFVIDRLRTISGVEKTLTCMVFESCKEETGIDLSNLISSGSRGI